MEHHNEAILNYRMVAFSVQSPLTHRSRASVNQTVSGLDNDLSPVRRPDII